MKQAWINLCVGVSCCGLIIALVLPAIQQSREAARRSQCRSNLKQFALALSGYHEFNRCLPPAYWTATGLGWQGILFPQMAAIPIGTIIELQKGRIGDWDENPERKRIVEGHTFSDLCPSDELHVEREKRPDGDRYKLIVHLKTAIRTSANGSRIPIGPSNYISVFGDIELMCSTPGTGLFSPNRCLSLDVASGRSAIADGLSETLMLGERDGSIHLAGNWAGTSYDENDPETCLDPQFVVDALVDSRPINGRDERCFSSRHPNGAHFLMADGAVKFLNENCSTTILRRLANRSDGIKLNDADIP